MGLQQGGGLSLPLPPYGVRQPFTAVVLAKEVIRSGVLWAEPALPSGDTHLGGPARSPSEAMFAPGR